MEFLEQEIVKLLKDGPMHAGRIMNKLNGFPLGMDVSLDGLRYLPRCRCFRLLLRDSGQMVSLVDL